jgi:hypothetical protein
MHIHSPNQTTLTVSFTQSSEIKVVTLHAMLKQQMHFAKRLGTEETYHARFELFAPSIPSII